MFLYEKYKVVPSLINSPEDAIFKNVGKYYQFYQFYNTHFSSPENAWLRLYDQYNFAKADSKSLNKTYYDIETYVKLNDTYTPFSAVYSYYEVNSIAFYNNVLNECEIIYVKRPQFHKLSDEEIYESVLKLYADKCAEKNDYIVEDMKIKITPFPDECSLLIYLFDRLKKQNIHILMGYNSKNFDDPYIIKRLKKSKPLEWESLISEFNQVRSFGELSFEFPDYNLVDLLDMYKPRDAGGKGHGKSLPDYSLNTLCKTVLELEKLDINKDFVESYENNIVEYLTYNMMDTLLTFKLDLKLGFLEQVFSLSRINNAPFGQTLQGRSFMFSYRNNTHFLNQNKILRHGKFTNEIYFNPKT